MGKFEELKQCFRVLEEIGKHSSTKIKKQILKQNESEMLKKLLVYTFNKAFVYTIGEKAIGDFTPKSESPVKSRGLFDVVAGYYDFFVLLNDLKDFKLRGNKAVDAVRNFINQDDEFFHEWCKRVLLRNLRNGISTKTVNTVFPDLVPVFTVILAELWDRSPIDQPCMVQRKMNGYRTIAFNRGDCVDLISRNGVRIPGFNNIREQIKKNLPVGMCFDGELASEGDDFSKAQELIFSEQDIDKSEMIYYVWDTMTIEEFERKMCAKGYFSRYDELSEYMEGLDLPNIQQLKNEIIYLGEEDRDVNLEIEEEFEVAIAKGWEGLMIKFDTPYEWDRTKNLLKYKQMNNGREPLDLEVVDVFEGKNNLSGTLGGVYVEYKGYLVGVGSGFKLYERHKYWANPNEIVGKIIKVQYFSEMKNSKGELSLQFPVFKGIHEQKNDELF